MKRKKSLRLDLQRNAFCDMILSLFFVLGLSTAPLPAASPKKEPLPPTPPQSGEYSYQIQSNTKNLGVLQDGVMGAGSKQLIVGKKGLNEIMVTAPGHGSRKIRFWLEPRVEGLLVIELAPLRDNINVKWESPFKSFAKGKLEAKASFCRWLQSKALDQAHCDRQSLLDDIFYADDSIFIPSDLTDYIRSKDLASFRSLLVHIDDDASTPEIESFYSRHPTQLSALVLASLHSLLLGDCPRVYAIFNDGLQAFDRIPSLRLHAAVCAEANNNSGLRDQIIAAGLGKERRVEPSLAYWSFQIAAPTAPKKAYDIAKACLGGLRGNDLRCQEAMEIATGMTPGKPFKIASFNYEEETFKSFLNIETRLPQGQHETLYLATAAQLALVPHALESYLFLAWINTSYNKDLAEDYYIERKIQVAREMGGTTLEKVIEAIEKQDLTQLLPPIYQRRIRFDPRDPNLWYRLIRAYSKAKQCKNLLKAVEAGEAFLPKYNASLLQMRGSCEVEGGRFKEALVTYSKVQEINPSAWSSHFNLANVYERLGKKNEALEEFKKTLAWKPPSETEGSIKAKINQLQNAKKPL